MSDAGLAAAVAAWWPDSPGFEARALTSGHINRTFEVAVTTPCGPMLAIVQRLNPHVFTDPLAVMMNLSRVSDHLHRHAPSLRGGRRAEPLAILRQPNGHAWLVDDAGAWWRAVAHVGGTETRLVPRNAAEAAEAAQAFGGFQRALLDLPGPPLAVVLPRFHDTPWRLEAFDAAVRGDAAGRAGGAGAERRFVDVRRREAGVLIELQQRGDLPTRIAHHDAKMSNVLLDSSTGDAVTVIDLDTVMPGLWLFDVGDLVRSMCSRAAEDGDGGEAPTADPALFAAVARGWLGAVGDVITPVERSLIVAAGITITFEQGVRFLTDWLNGDVYYATHAPDQNLRRARAQFQLVESLECQRSAFEALIAAL